VRNALGGAEAADTLGFVPGFRTEAMVDSRRQEALA
jgi:hypothetical protein